MPDSPSSDPPGAEQLRTALAEVLQDFDVPEVRGARVDFAIADRVAPLNMEHIPEPDSWYGDERRVLLQVADSVTDVTASEIEEYKAAVASHLQDFVVDETGRPWPERVVEGAVRVLDVGLDAHRLAVWSYAGHTIGPVGQLDGRGSADLMSVRED